MFELIIVGVLAAQGLALDWSQTYSGFVNHEQCAAFAMGVVGSAEGELSPGLTSAVLTWSCTYVRGA